MVASKHRTKLTSQHVPGGQVKSMTQEALAYTSRELQGFENIYVQTPGEYVWG